jgi:Fic family protein
VLEADLDEGPRSPELIEILNYVAAAEHAFAWVNERRRITTGLILDLHRLLLRGTPTDGPEVGQVRSIQVVIGAGGRVRDARFVPSPPGPDLQQSLQDLVDWMNRGAAPGRAVVDTALAHYQFETLHPLNDGNGRIGRLIVVLHMLAAGVLSEPFLSVSPWFEARRREYQDELQHLSETGEFDRWVGFFSEGIRAQAEETTMKIRDLLDFQEQAKALARGSGRHGVAVEIAELLIARPIISASWAAKRFEVTFPAANNAIAKLVEVGLLREMTGRRYGRVFAADRVLNILER